MTQNHCRQNSDILLGNYLTLYLLATNYCFLFGSFFFLIPSGSSYQTTGTTTSLPALPLTGSTSYFKVSICVASTLETGKLHHQPHSSSIQDKNKF